MSWQLAPARRARPVCLIVLLLHVLAGWLLSQRMAPPAGMKPGNLTSVWLLPPRLPQRQPRPPAPTQAQAARRLPSTIWIPPQDTAVAPAAALPAAPSPTAAPAVRSSVAPLTLSLPASVGPAASAAWRNPALTDERSNSPRLSPEQRIARAIGGEADQPDEINSPTRRRIRYRGGCYDVQQSRDAQLDPFNASVKQAPAQLKPCSW